jgi:NAD(P)-dependent dehydrogenase (short-subunit alcohol dehydrogenase family)
MNRRLAIVTGASSGIGRATAIALAQRGYDIGVGYRSDAAGASVTASAVRHTGRRAETFRLDLADPQVAAATVEHAALELGGLDVFVNNAGVNRRAPFLEETLADWQRVLTVDLTGPFACAQAAARHMVARGRGGRIINVTSVHEFVPIAGGSSYCAAKGGLGLLTKVMALELAPYGITVNAVSPGETATPMNGVPDNLDAADIRRPAIPAGRPGRAHEVAALIAYLAEPDSAYTTGVSITIDGGLTLMSAIANQQYTERHSPEPQPTSEGVIS